MTDYEPGPNQTEINRKQAKTNEAQIKFGEAIVSDLEARHSLSEQKASDITDRRDAEHIASESRQDAAEGHASDDAELREGEYVAQQQVNDDQGATNTAQDVTNTAQGNTNRELRVSNKEARQALEEVRAAANAVTAELTRTVHRNRNLLRILAAVLALITLIGAGSLFEFRHLAQQRDRTITRQARQSMVVAHGQCHRLNDGRRRVATALNDGLDITFNFPSTPPRTPAQQEALGDLSKAVKKRIALLLAAIDCDKAAPLPLDPTPDELDQLPKPEPIPPLKLN